MADAVPTPEWRWLYSELLPFARPQAISAGLLLAGTSLSLVDPLIVRWLIDSGLREGRWSAILASVALFCAVYGLRMALVFRGTLLSTRIFNVMVLRLRLRLIRRLQRHDASFFSEHSVGELAQRFEQDAEQVGRVGVDLFPLLVRIVLSITLTLGVMAALDWRLTVVVLPFVPALLYLRVHFRQVLESAADTTRNAAGSRAGFLNEVLGAGIQIQLLGAEFFARRRFAREAVRAGRAYLDQRRKEMLYFVGALGISTAATATVLLVGAHQVVTGALTLGTFVALYTYLLRLLEPVGSAVETYTALKRAGGSLRRIVALESARSGLTEPAAPSELDLAAVGEIGCEGAEFGYRDGRPLLRGADLTLRRGETVSLIGPSGSGKSTLAKLLVRIHDVHAGTVRIAGTDVRELRVSALRGAVSFVPAQPVLFRGSIRDNVLLGNRRAGDDELASLAAMVRFDEVLGALPGGWEHVLGTGGSGLSDGEKQRLGLLRALVQRRPVLLLDEATGALDPALEHAVLAGLEAYVRDRIVLVITHRPATARWADRMPRPRASSPPRSVPIVPCGRSRGVRIGGARSRGPRPAPAAGGAGRRGPRRSGDAAGFAGDGEPHAGAVRSAPGAARWNCAGVRHTVVDRHRDRRGSPVFVGGKFVQPPYLEIAMNRVRGLQRMQALGMMEQADAAASTCSYLFCGTCSSNSANCTVVVT